MSRRSTTDTCPTPGSSTRWVSGYSAASCTARNSATSPSWTISAGPASIPALLDEAAAVFAAAVRGSEGREGTRAFVEKRKPSWVTQVE